MGKNLTILFARIFVVYIFMYDGLMVFKFLRIEYNI